MLSSDIAAINQRKLFRQERESAKNVTIIVECRARTKSIGNNSSSSLIDQE